MYTSIKRATQYIDTNIYWSDKCAADAFDTFRYFKIIVIQI